MPVLTQLDYWTFLVDLLDLNSLKKLEVEESRSVLAELKA